MDKIGLKVMIKNKNRIKYHLQKAIYIAKNGRPGPVWIDIPADIQRMEVEPNELEEFSIEEDFEGNRPKLDSNFRSKVKKVVKTS